MKLKIGDMLVYIFIVILIGFSVLGLKWLGESTDSRQLVVELNGEIVKSVNLDGIEHPRDIRIETGDGGYNILQIAQDGAKVIEANCPDRVCVRSSRITIPGQTIVCLPHRLIIRIEGGREDGPNIDSTAS